MPYFVILSVFAVALCVEGLVLAFCAAVPALHKGLPYFSRILVGSTLGFLTANLASLLVGVVPVLVGMVLGIDKDDPGAQIVAGFTLLGLFLGPLIASPLGFLGGAWVGWRKARRAHTA